MTALANLLFPDISFTDVLSLGADCEAANGLRIIGRHQTRGLFDWLVTPLDAIDAILADDGARLSERFVAVYNGTSARCDAYGVLYHHELPRDPDNQIVFSTDLLAACRSKLQHKMRSFCRACEDATGPVLFLRVGTATDLPWDRHATGASATACDINDVACALSRRFPGLDFRLLVATVAPTQIANAGALLDPRVALVALPCRGISGWKIAEDDWRCLFSRLAFRGGNRQNESIGEKLYWFGLADHAVEASSPCADGGSAQVSPPSACSGEAAEALWACGTDLLRRGQSFSAVERWGEAFDRGCRNLNFLRDYLGLLTGETRYSTVLQVIDQIRGEGVGSMPHRAKRHLAMLSGHAKLALAHPRDDEIAAAAAHSSDDAWLGPQALRTAIASAIAAKRAFAFVRLGDGEARFLLSQVTEPEGVLTGEERHAMGDVVWENWFGDPLASVSPAACAALSERLIGAITSVDVLGISSSERLASDTGHYGYLAWQERWLRRLFADRPDMLFADALAHRRLNIDMPFLAALLEGLDVLGVVSPHPGLAQALAERLRIAEVVSHVVPGEGRLPSAEASRASGKHFPTAFESLLATLVVPRPGCVFLVAAGLLGKIYCARIKALGGIALDIGALADAWMGFDTRDGQFAGIAQLPQRSGAAETESVEKPAPTAIVGCVSFGKTGSMALADAIRMAGCPDAVHLHYLGPRAIEIKRKDPEPMLDLAQKIAGRIADKSQRFRFVTAVRDPIARILSQAFYRADRHRERHGVNIVRDPEALIAWWESTAIARLDVCNFWFDDTFKATFGFDFRGHAFDHERKSLRFNSNQLRLLVLRQEDERRTKEAELCWLLERDGVVLRQINDAVAQGYSATYRLFLKSFVAPAAWLDTYYETDVIKHFYTDAERNAFRQRWSGR